VTSLLGPPTPATFDGLAAALINALVADPLFTEAVLILDYHHVIDSQLVHASLTYLIERPPDLHIVPTPRCRSHECACAAIWLRCAQPNSESRRPRRRHC
jgi:hypothetical protein